MIKIFSQRIAMTLGAHLHADRDSVEVFAYGLEIILGALVKLALILLLSFIMDAFKTTLICLITFASLRYFGGGVHLSTYSRCLTVGSALLLSLGKVATIDVGFEAFVLTSLLAMLLGVYTVFYWVPAETEKKEIKDAPARLLQKKKTLLILVMWFVVTAVLGKHRLTAYAFAVTLGSFTSFFLMTPWGYRLVKALDSILNTTGKEVPNDV